MLNWLDCLFSGPAKCCAYCPGHTDNFWAIACFPLILICCFRTIRTTRRVSIQNLKSTNWENIRPQTDRWLSCPSTLVASVTVKTDQSFFPWNIKITLMWKLFYFLFIFVFASVVLSERIKNSPVQEKCRKTWVADESLWECVCDQMQCRIVMPSDFLRLNNNNN